jgi:hypothetical protein
VLEEEEEDVGDLLAAALLGQFFLQLPGLQVRYGAQAFD